MSWESLLPMLVIAALAAASNWLQARAKAKENQPPPTPRQPPLSRPLQRTAQRPAEPKPVSRTLSDLEAELRRMLQGEEAPKESPPPPPILRAERPRTPATSAPTLPRPAPPVSPRRLVEESEGSVVFDSPLTAAPAAYARAQAVYADAAVQVEQAAERGAQRATHLQPPKDRRRPTRTHAMTWLRRRDSARQGMIASFILGPPKALEAPD